MQRRVFPKEILFIFCLAFLLRMLFCFLFKEEILYIQEHIFTDTHAYIQIAGNLLSGKGLIAPGGEIVSHPPLYPLFLSLVYFLFGEGYWPVRIIQSILSALSCVVVYLLTRPALNAGTAKIAAFLCAVYPFFIFFAGFELTETLFILLLLTSFLCLGKALRQPLQRYFIAGGVLLGLAALCRPFILGFIPFMLVAGAVQLRAEKKRILIKRAGILLLFFFIIFSPWIVRNYIHFHKFVPATTSWGKVLWEGNNPKATGGPCRHWPEEIKGLSEIEQERYLRRMAYEVIVDNPKRFGRLMGAKFIRFWNIIPNYEGFSSLKYKVVSLFSYGIILPFSVSGIVLCLKKGRQLLLFYLIIVFFTISHMIFLASVRYRTPVMPFMIVFAAHSIQRLITYVKGFRDAA